MLHTHIHQKDKQAKPRNRRQSNALSDTGGALERKLHSHGFGFQMVNLIDNEGRIGRSVSANKVWKRLLDFKKEKVTGRRKLQS